MRQCDCDNDDEKQENYGPAYCRRQAAFLVMGTKPMNAKRVCERHLLWAINRIRGGAWKIVLC